MRHCYHLPCRAAAAIRTQSTNRTFGYCYAANIDELGLEHFITAGDLGQFLTDLLDLLSPLL